MNKYGGEFFSKMRSIDKMLVQINMKLALKNISCEYLIKTMFNKKKQDNKKKYEIIIYKGAFNDYGDFLTKKIMIRRNFKFLHELHRFICWLFDRYVAESTKLDFETYNEKQKEYETLFIGKEYTKNYKGK